MTSKKFKYDAENLMAFGLLKLNMWTGQDWTCGRGETRHVDGVELDMWTGD